jgi:hypothetical protein
MSACVVLDAGFWYYVIAWMAGCVIGTLGLFTWFAVKTLKKSEKNH